MPVATVSADIAPVYEKPSTESVRTDEALYGMSVQVMQQSESGWSYLRTEMGTEGYTPSNCLHIDPEVATAWRKYKKMTVLSTYIDILKGPDENSGRITSVPRGGIVVPLKSAGEDGWQKVGLVNGAVGYTHSSYLGEVFASWQSLPPDDMRWNLVESALSYNGTAWRGGGRSPLGIDAGGLVAMAYLLNGVVIPRRPFFAPGGVLKKREPHQMDEGDLLYFPDSVGMYIGDDHFVHATLMPGSEGVVVSSLNQRDGDYRADLATRIVAVASLY